MSFTSHQFISLAMDVITIFRMVVFYSRDPHLLPSCRTEDHGSALIAFSASQHAIGKCMVDNYYW